MRQDVGVGTAHRLKITLADVEPPVWRRLMVPSDYTLAQVHEVLLTGMGWAGYHLYSFQIGATRYAEIDDDWPDDSVDAASVRLADLVGRGDRFVFEYDFGDGWEHAVVVEEVLATAGRFRPLCLAGGRACPPEDVGGPWGYAEFLEAIADPAHERHADFIEWIGGAFDPEAFDADEVDQIFATGSASSS
jgi:Plasmid pRiA4b ORF-3-like protein